MCESNIEWSKVSYDCDTLQKDIWKSSQRRTEFGEIYGALLAMVAMRCRWWKKGLNNTGAWECSFIWKCLQQWGRKRGVIPIWESCRCCLQRYAVLGCWMRRRRMPVEGRACANGPAEGQAASVAVTGRGRPWGEGSAQSMSPSWQDQEPSSSLEKEGEKRGWDQSFGLHEVAGAERSCLFVNEEGE